MASTIYLESKITSLSLVLEYGTLSEKLGVMTGKKSYSMSKSLGTKTDMRICNTDFLIALMTQLL